MSRGLPDLTSGSIPRALLKLAVPIVFANLLQTAYQLIDTFWVGRLGASAVAAVSLSFPLIFFLISIGIGFSVSGTILVAQYQGQRDSAAVDHVAAQALLAVVSISLIVALIGVPTAGAIVAFLGAAHDVVPMAAEYMEVTFTGLPFLYAYIMFQSLMRGVGDARTPLVIVTGTVVLNFFLDPLFILGYGPVPALGVSGAALATIITQGLAAVVGLAMLFSGRYGIVIHWRHLRPAPAVLGHLTRLGLPTAVEQSSRALGLIVMTMLVAGFGTITLAAYGIGSRMLSFIIIPALGLSQATSALVGQNMGAGASRRAEHTTYLSAGFAFVALSLVAIIVEVFAPAIVRAFVPDSPQVVVQGATFVRITAITYGAVGAQIVIAGGFRGSGNTLVSMILALVSLWVLQFPIAWALSAHTTLGASGIWIAYPVQQVLTLGIALTWFVQGGWKQRRVIETTEEEEITPDIGGA